MQLANPNAREHVVLLTFDVSDWRWNALRVAANCDHPGSRRAEQKSAEVGRAVAGIPRLQNERIVYLALPEFLVGNNSMWATIGCYF